MEVNLVHHACTVTSKTINNYQTKLWKTKLLYTVVQVKEKKKHSKLHLPHFL